jgi:hypothetical protein
LNNHESYFSFATGFITNIVLSLAADAYIDVSGYV